MSIAYRKDRTAGSVANHPVAPDEDREELKFVHMQSETFKRIRGWSGPTPSSSPVADGKIRYGIISFAVRPGGQDLLDDINKHLLAFRGTPEYLAILEKYRLTPAELPPAKMTTAEICTG